MSSDFKLGTDFKNKFGWKRKGLPKKKSVKSQDSVPTLDGLTSNDTINSLNSLNSLNSFNSVNSINDVDTLSDVNSERKVNEINYRKKNLHRFPRLRTAPPNYNNNNNNNSDINSDNDINNSDDITNKRVNYIKQRNKYIKKIHKDGKRHSKSFSNFRPKSIKLRDLEYKSDNNNTTPLSEDGQHKSTYMKHAKSLNFREFNPNNEYPKSNKVIPSNKMPFGMNQEIITQKRHSIAYIETRKQKSEHSDINIYQWPESTPKYLGDIAESPMASNGNIEHLESFPNAPRMKSEPVVSPNSTKTSNNTVNNSNNNSNNDINDSASNVSSVVTPSSTNKDRKKNSIFSKIGNLFSGVIEDTNNDDTDTIQLNIDYNSDTNILVSVVGIRKIDDYAEYEIEVTYKNTTWILYRRFKEFNDLDKKLRQIYKNSSQILKYILKLPSRMFRGNMQSDVLINRREQLDMYLKKLISSNDICMNKEIARFLKITSFDENLSANELANNYQKYMIDLWKRGNKKKIDFEMCHLFEIRFSCNNIKLKKLQNKGILLKIYQKETHKMLPIKRLLMTTEVVIDTVNPKFGKTLLYNYIPTNNNDLIIELDSVDDSDNYNISNASNIGIANLKLMKLLSRKNHKINIPIQLISEYMDDISVPETKNNSEIDDSTNDTSTLDTKKKRAISMPNLNRISDKMNDDEEATMTHLPSIYVVIKKVSNIDKIKPHQIISKESLPAQLKIETYTTDIEDKLKNMISQKDFNKFKVALYSSQQSIFNFDYFIIKNDTENKSKIHENIGNYFLQVWKKLLDFYPKKKAIQKTIADIIVKLIQRYEWNLSHFKLWLPDGTKYRGYATIQWEKIMKKYVALLLETCELCLNIIDDTKEDETKNNGNNTDTDNNDNNDDNNNFDNISEFEKKFIIQVLSVCSQRIKVFHKQTLPLITTELKRKQISVEKRKRYDYIQKHFSNDDNSHALHTWQQDFVERIANNQQYQTSVDVLFIKNNPTFLHETWEYITPIDVENKIKLTNKHKSFIIDNWMDYILSMFNIISKHCHGKMCWQKIPSFPLIQQILAELIVWPKIIDKSSKNIIKYVTELMKIKSMKYEIGLFTTAILCNTDAMYGIQVEICFRYLRDWIRFSDIDGLLPDSFCYDEFITATHVILSQDNWEIICVYLSFLLHHSRLFRDSMRKVIIGDILIDKYFKSLFCHWNHKVREYYYKILLYCTNRIGYVNEKRRNELINETVNKSMNKQIIDLTHHMFTVYDLFTSSIYKQYLSNNKPTKNNTKSKPKPSKKKPNNNDNTKENILKITTLKERKEDEDDKKHLLPFYVDMTYISRIETDQDLMVRVSVNVTNLQLNRNDIEKKYKAYIDASLLQFAQMCKKYEIHQLTKKKSWKFGEVLLSTKVYHVVQKNHDLNKFMENKGNINYNKFT